jgi:asparagine synthase (glutamine-hydrolysing)
MLSGGLDSSTIVALARDILVAEGKPPLRTYSAISDRGVECPETTCVAAVIAQGNLEASCSRPSDTDAHLVDLENAFGRLEDPFEGSWTLLSMMFLNARKDGCRALLTGVDGDLAMGVSSTYIARLLQDGLWSHAWKESRDFSRHYYRGKISASALYFTALRSSLTPEKIRLLKNRVGFQSRYRRLLGGRMVAGEFASRVNLTARLGEYESSLHAPAGAIKPSHNHIVQVPYLTAGIERYERLANYFGVEARHPLLGLGLLRFCSALPPEYRIRGGWTKYLLRGVADFRLPKVVAWREGHEQLGSDFVANRARALCITGKLPVKAMKKSLSPFLDQRSLTDWERENGGEHSTQWLITAMEHYSLHSWLLLTR